MATDQPINQKSSQNGITFDLQKQFKAESDKNLQNYIYRSEDRPEFKPLVNLAKSIINERKEESRKHDQNYGIYPDVSDPNFAARLARKTEFYRLRSEQLTDDNDPCKQSLTEFTPTSIQRLVSRFLNPMTPYNGMLLYHGVGVGKTCSAITVAETFLEAAPEKMVYIIAPQAIADGFRRTIFDINRIEPNSAEEAKLTGEKWKSPQCTGMTYLRLLDMANNVNKEEIVAGVDKLVKERYKIMGYRAFANWVEKQLEKIPRQTLSAEEIKDRETKILRKLFDDHLFIIDEAHNLRDVTVSETDISISDEPTESSEEDKTYAVKMSDVAEGKKLTPILKKILRVANGLRLMLMTATPMYNTAPEIVFLLNLLLMNDKRGTKLLEVSKIFDNNGRLNQSNPSNKRELTDTIKRYVSYMRGENPITFPLRLTPTDCNIRDLFKIKDLDGKKTNLYPQFSISRKEINKKNPNTPGLVSFEYNDIKIMKEMPLKVHLASNTFIGKILYEHLYNHYENNTSKTEDVKQFDFILDRTMQMGNIMYEDKTFGGDGWDKHFEVINTDHRGNKLKQYKWKHANPIESIFGKENLKNYSPKIASIIDKIEAGEGISFVYSRYVKAGALPIAIALEVRGWVRAFADGTTLPLLFGQSTKTFKNKYVILTSDDTISPNFASLVRYVTTFTNENEINGSKAKVIIGSQVASEGLDLKCIRQIHLLDGWYHLNRIEQIVGRGVRFCSHKDLPKEKRNCLIYLHAIHVNSLETADLYAYRLAVKKAQPIGDVSHLLKKYAWDCHLNRKAIIFTDLGEQKTIDAFGKESQQLLEDKPFTNSCDFKGNLEKDENDKPIIDSKTGNPVFYCPPYTCGADLSPGEEGRNKSTELVEDFQSIFLDAKRNLISKFKKDITVMKVSDALTFFKEVDDDSFKKIGLRNILDNVKIKRDDGIYGTLKLLNNFIVFQPDKITDLRIPMALRYGRAYPREHLHSTLVVEPGTILVPIKKDVKPVGKYSDAINKIKEWDAIINEIFNNPTGKLSDRTLIPSFNTSGWRWVLRHFNKPGIKEDARLIALSWFADNYWSSEELLTIFRHWLENPNEDKEYSQLFITSENCNRIELFQGRINGYFVYNTTVGETGKLETYCKTRNVIEQCTPNLLEDVNSIIGGPIVVAKDKKSGKSDTADYFGFLVSKQKTTIFKSADNTNPGKFRGAECANTSNLDNHIERIRGIYDLFKKSTDGKLSAIKGVLLKDDFDNELKKIKVELAKGLDEEKEIQILERKFGMTENSEYKKEFKEIIKAIKEENLVKTKRLIRSFKQKNLKYEFENKTIAKEIINDIEDLSLNQTCPYMEFLFRYADMKKVDGKRWFLSVVDSARSGIKMT